MELSRLSPNVLVCPSLHFAHTVMMSLTETEQLLKAARPEPEFDVPANPYLLAADNMPEPGTIYARYLRSDRWVPLRIGTLSLKGAALMAGVFIGASPVRLAVLQSGLAPAGYVVTGSPEPRALARLASTEARPVDAALIDAGWLATARVTQVDQLLLAHRIPSLRVHGDAKRARIEVDRLLAVV